MTYFIQPRNCIDEIVMGYVTTSSTTTNDYIYIPATDVPFSYYGERIGWQEGKYKKSIKFICRYCGSSNKAKRRHCSQCGAPRGEA